MAVLTYKSAKKGLLNTVNTEYHKRTFDKLEEISQELISEFDPDSPNYWVSSEPMHKVLEKIHDTFEKNKKEILESKEFSPGVPDNKASRRLSDLVKKIKSDPFIPKEIREYVTEALEKRADTMLGIHLSEISKYIEELSKGKHGNDYELNSAVVHNRINTKLYENGCGISQVEEQVHDIRLFIQQYLENFNPFK